MIFIFSMLKKKNITEKKYNNIKICFFLIYLILLFYIYFIINIYIYITLANF